MKKIIFVILLMTAISAKAAEVMTWVPAYSIEQSYQMLTRDFGGTGMKDGLSRLALQFWQPSLTGGLEKDVKYGKISDADIKKFADWAKSNRIQILLCIYNPPPTAGQPWEWARAQAAFNNPTTYTHAILAEIDRLAALDIVIDGVDMDLESSIDQSEQDKANYLAMMKQVSNALKAKGKILTVATYGAKFNAPNLTYWSALTPFIDGLTPMAYENSGYQVACENFWDHPADWCEYQGQINLTNPLDKRKLTLGMPSNVDYSTLAQRWMGKTNVEHLKGVKAIGAGVALWDADLHPSWQTAEVWNIIKAIKNSDANVSSSSSTVSNPIKKRQD